MEAEVTVSDSSVSGAPTVQDFLRLVAERGGTDLHISAESPPVMRLNGELRPLPFPPLSANDTKTLCYSVLTESQKHRFEEQQELDFSFGIRGLSRFRKFIELNCFRGNSNGIRQRRFPVRDGQHVRDGTQ